jgi:hypothetical protein
MGATAVSKVFDAPGLTLLGWVEREGSDGMMEESEFCCCCPSSSVGTSGDTTGG